MISPGSRQRARINSPGSTLGLACIALGLSGCASLIGNVTGGLVDDLSNAILESDDPATVRDGAPAYLLMLDALLRRNADSPALLRGAATLNGAYATAFVADDARRRAFATKAFHFALRAACLEVAWMCDVRTVDFDELDQRAASLQHADVPGAYALATAWAGWIQAHADDWNAIADLARVKPILARVVELDEAYDHGGPHLYMGVFETLIPPASGGRPETGREHFERAIELTDGRHQMAKVLFAEHYARLVFDRELHDALLNDVLRADSVAPGLTLMNTIAKEQARVLLDTADDYF
ncbi:MAG: hypothetical protein F4Z28_12930 [Gammaproteobacteria bacterium]|nr:hypothetical protein [Gammaproteobacteria bacterium]